MSVTVELPPVAIENRNCVTGAYQEYSIISNDRKTSKKEVITLEFSNKYHCVINKTNNNQVKACDMEIEF